MTTPLLSLQAVPDLTSLLSTNKALVVLSETDANASQGDMQLGLVALSDYATFLNAGLTTRVTALESSLSTGLTVAQGGTGVQTLNGMVKGNGSSAFTAAVAGADYMAPAPAFRNLLLNALGTINQRAYVSGTATATAKQYTLDRWCVLTSGESLSWTTSGGVATMTAPAGGVAQVIEGASIAGGTYSLSWIGTATATVNGTAVGNGASAVLPANTSATVVFSNGTFANPQLELGAVTSFDWHPAGLELALCQRYCCAFNFTAGTAITVGVQYSATSAYCSVILPVTLITVPTVAFSGPGLQWNGDGTTNSVSPTMSWGANNSADFLFPISGATVGRAGYAAGKPGGSTRVVFDAELVP